ncbi:TIGR02391 family protein [Vibrio sp. YMD68]|uniref:TIGR02391 family protein n=1 Tax=Vibrio sp. YMD68 TaxID=3042300 RepID=UPI00249BADFD|nr:TIGR02391 family protein [Vibrio sp. YMD68]WGV99109.1 TIGR02391 family protein [Vibrio sp. YMD68]
MMGRFAGIEYRGMAGISCHCIDAVVEILHFGRTINEVKILTVEGEHSNSHALLLNVDTDIVIAIKTGFASGYPGEGPNAFSSVLSLLQLHTEEINEYSVSSKLVDRLDDSCLLEKDLDWINNERPIRPNRWYDYIDNRQPLSHLIFRYFPRELPLALIDQRLYDLVLEFKTNPDNALMSGYRLLERIIREKSGLKKETGSKLFSKAFLGDESPFFWADLDGGESKGRASLFSSTFMAFRNHRAHKEPEHNILDDIREFLLLNQLFVLERSAKIRETTQ